MILDFIINASMNELVDQGCNFSYLLLRFSVFI